MHHHDSQVFSLRCFSLQGCLLLLLACCISFVSAATLQYEKNEALQRSVEALQKEWAVIKYQVQDEDEQERRIAALSDQSKVVSEQYVAYAEPLIWQAIILSTQAGINGGLSALGFVKQAKDLLLKAEEIDVSALDGSVYTSLGSLYYQVPGWPIGFGSDKKARHYLQKAIQLSPNGIDSNYFYGDFLLDQGEYVKAIYVLNHALKASPRLDRPLADEGRKQEIQIALNRAKQKTN